MCQIQVGLSLRQCTLCAKFDLSFEDERQIHAYVRNSVLSPPWP